MKIFNNFLPDTQNKRWGEINLNHPEGGKKMGHCGAAWEFCSCRKKLAATRVVKGCREKYLSRDYMCI